MTEKINDGGPAFPERHMLSLGESNVIHGWKVYSGLTKREWFAGMALQGIVASRDLQSSAIYKMDKEWTVNEAYAFADAMIKESEKK